MKSAAHPQASFVTRHLSFVTRHCAELVGFGCHDEVVAMQAPDLVCPPGYRDPAPFRQNGRMMAFLFRQSAYSYSECQCTGKISEKEFPLEAGNALSFHQLPIRDLRLELVDFLLRYLRSAHAT